MYSELFREAFLLVALCSGVPLAASALAGLLVAFLQSITQIQDASFPYFIKALAVAAVLALGGQWIFLRCTFFLGQCVVVIQHLGRMP